MLAECLWKPNSGYKPNEVVGSVFQQWWQWVTFTGADGYDHGMQALVHHWQKCIANGGTSVETLCFVAENLPYLVVLLCSLLYFPGT